MKKEVRVSDGRVGDEISAWEATGRPLASLRLLRSERGGLTVGVACKDSDVVLIAESMSAGFSSYEQALAALGRIIDEWEPEQ